VSPQSHDGKQEFVSERVTAAAFKVITLGAGASSRGRYRWRSRSWIERASSASFSGLTRPLHQRHPLSGKTGRTSDQMSPLSPASDTSTRVPS